MMDEKNKFKRTRLACYMAYFTMSSIFCVPPVLFVTFHEMYGVSYTLLGSLVLTNFCTQLGIDLLFSLIAKKIRPEKLVRITPMITTAGLLIYALVPSAFPQYAYAGLLVGTIIFSVSSGLSEVFLSPTIAAIPSDNPQRDMSLLHSLYAFGVFTMVVVSTVFIHFFTPQRWATLVTILAFLPLIPAIMFMFSPMPDMSGEETANAVKGNKKRAVGLALCFGCIFFGSCAENTMSNWLSSYMENALGIDKALGDILGVAAFAILLGLARIGYARFGKKIAPVLLFGMIGAVVCYATVALTSNVIISFVACILTGLFTSMLWPGTLILMEENVEGAGVAAFALLAAGGDLGAAIAPQLMGIVIDGVAATDFAMELGLKIGMSAEQIGLKVGMLVSAIFPFVGTLIVVFTVRYFKKRNQNR